MGLQANPAQGMQMAIYSVNHRPIGKSTQSAPYTAAAHIAYITRSSALNELVSARMPESSDQAGTWLRAEEDRDRANARVVDKVMLALPRELSPEQRVQLVRAFAEEVTHGECPWLAAFHDNSVDGKNPHCHLVIRDRHPATGKRVIKTSEKGSTERIRVLWEAHANVALEQHGRAERIDRRSHEARGIKRNPTIHVGVRANRLGQNAGRRSGPRWYRNGAGARRRQREVDYVAIDAGRSRASRNREIEAEWWSEIDADSRNRELAALRSLHLPPEQAGRNVYRDFWETYRGRQSQEKDADPGWEPDD